jgi:hypothetical protein
MTGKSDDCSALNRFFAPLSYSNCRQKLKGSLALARQGAGITGSGAAFLLPRGCSRIPASVDFGGLAIRLQLRGLYSQ